MGSADTGLLQFEARANNTDNDDAAAAAAPRTLLALDADPNVLQVSAFVWHLARDSDWQAALKAGKYNGSAECQNDGFIHLSAHCELEKSAELHRKGEEGLLLLKVHTNDLPGLKWEWSKSRGNCFAHIYGTLNTSVVQG